MRKKQVSLKMTSSELELLVDMVRNRCSSMYEALEEPDAKFSREYFQAMVDEVNVLVSLSGKLVKALSADCKTNHPQLRS